MILSVELFSSRVVFPASLVIIFAALVLRRKKDGQKDGRNPPYISSTVPYFGHLIDFLVHGPSFWIRLRERVANLPIYSINFVTQEIYIVNDVDLIAQIQREAASKDRMDRAISQRTQLIDFVFGKLFGHSDKILAIMKDNHDGKLEGKYYRPDIHRVMATGLGAATESMEELYRRTMEHMARDVEKMTREGPKHLDLLQWLRTSFGHATAFAFHGPNHPFANSPELMQDLWDFDDGRPLMGIGILPHIVASKAFAARERCAEAYRKFNKNGAGECAKLIHDIVALEESYGWSEDSHARSQLSMVAGLTSGNVPAIFWLISMILCDNSLKTRILNELRDAVALEVPGKANGDSTAHLTVDIKALRQNCPLLLATHYEVLRTKTCGSVAVRVERDYLLDDRYVLNKDALIMVPGVQWLSDPAKWGPDADVFRPERFLDGKHHNSPNFRPFGGGYNICPARHLVKDQMLGMAALVLFTYEITPGGGPDGGAAFSEPAERANNITTVKNPATRFPVCLTPRKGFEGVKWHFN